MSGRADGHRADWPHPNDRPCEQCGHVWFAGERSHEYFEHTAERAEHVTVLCVLCRRQRGLSRAASADDD
jgi:hypothetical protein